jgi:hypothetical protein
LWYLKGLLKRQGRQVLSSGPNGIRE